MNREQKQVKIKNMRFRLVIIIILMFISITNIVCGEETGEGYLIQFEVTTTSDWTEVEFMNCEPHLIGMEFISSEISEDKVNITFNRISKPGYDDSEVVVNFTYFIERDDLPKHKLIIDILKGDIGTTSLSVYSIDGKQERLIDTVVSEGSVEGDATNRREFVLSPAKIRKYGTTTITPNQPDVEPLVLAFYYPWYRPQTETQKFYHWKPDEPNFSSTHTPELGFYTSIEEDLMRQHIEWAKSAGIDGFVVSWWDVGWYEDDVLLKMREVFDEEDFDYCIYYERTDGVAETKSHFRYIKNNFISDDNYIRVEDKPVLFIFERALYSLSVDEWRDCLEYCGEELGTELFTIEDRWELERLPLFDGMHSYFPYHLQRDEISENYRYFSSFCHYNGKVFVATVSPGIQDWRNKYPFRQKREDGEYYKDIWRASIESGADWVVITSFNEWHEGTEIEPSEEFGTHYLELTEGFSEQFKKMRE